MITVLLTIGYFIVGVIVLCLENKLDRCYRFNLMGIDQELWRMERKEDDPYWASGFRSLDEYHRRTQLLPKNPESFLKKRLLIMACAMGFIELALWPITQLIWPIYITSVYKMIYNKKVKELA